MVVKNSRIIGKSIVTLGVATKISSPRSVSVGLRTSVCIYTHTCTYTNKLCILEFFGAIAVMRVQYCNLKTFLDNKHQNAKDVNYPSVVKVHSLKKKKRRKIFQAGM